MIYADTSFLFSFYARDANTERAAATYRTDARRPLLFTPWQRLELRNTIRLAGHRLTTAGSLVPFSEGNVLKHIVEDTVAGRLKHEDVEWRDAFRLADDLSEEHTPELGCAIIDLWHVANAILLKADTFWTFDAEQYALARAVRKFRHLPKLTG